MLISWSHLFDCNIYYFYHQDQTQPQQASNPNGNDSDSDGHSHTQESPDQGKYLQYSIRSIYAV